MWAVQGDGGDLVSGDGTFLFGLFVCLGLGMFVGGVVAGAGVNQGWRTALVDRPAWVEAVRQEVLSERVTDALRAVRMEIK